MEKNNSHPKLLNFTLDILSPFLSTEFRFEKNKEDNKEVSYVLQNVGPLQSRVDAKNKTVSVVRMKNGYWLGFGFCYFKKQNNKKQLKQFGIQVFDEFSPLFRVDWASGEIKEGKSHAQPHWHFDTDVAVKKRDETYPVPTYEQYLKMTASQDETVKSSLGRFHFFMNWNMEKEKDKEKDKDKDKDKETPYLDLSDESLFKQWLVKTMEYIDKELRFIIKR